MRGRLLRSRIAWFALASLGLGLMVWWRVLESTNLPSDFNPDDLTVVELIDRLADVSEEGVGTHSTAWTSDFIAVNNEVPRFRGGVLGSKPPVVHPVMRELVRRGAASLPDLLAHVSDRRLTRLKVGGSNIGGTNGFAFGAMWHSDEYDCRFANPKLQPKGVNTGMEVFFSNEYRIRIGDICFVLVGQIVNRHLCVARYQPSACLVVNSPIETVELAAAVRKDWSGLTEAQHLESLLQDVGSDGYASPPALARLCFYYPEKGEPLAKKFLSRPLYDYYKVRLFIKGKLLEGESPQKWRQAIATFAQENGQAAGEALPVCLHDFVAEKTADRGEEFAEARATVKKVLAALYPDFDATRQGFFLNAVTERDQTNLIEQLSGIRSSVLDAGVLQAFRSIDLTRYEKTDRVYVDVLAVACMDRLIGKGVDNELRVYCERRIRELEERPRTLLEEQPLEFLRERLNRINDNKG